MCSYSLNERKRSADSRELLESVTSSLWLSTNVHYDGSDTLNIRIISTMSTVIEVDGTRQDMSSSGLSQDDAQ